MARMPPAPLAVLAQGDAVRVVALGLLGLVVPALALLAREGDGYPDVSAGHGTACSESRWFVGRRGGKGKPRTGARSARKDSAYGAAAVYRAATSAGRSRGCPPSTAQASRTNAACDQANGVADGRSPVRSGIS